MSGATISNLKAGAQTESVTAILNEALELLRQTRDTLGRLDDRMNGGGPAPAGRGPAIEVADPVPGGLYEQACELRRIGRIALDRAAQFEARL